MNKKICYALVLPLMLGLSGCGDNGGNGGKTSGNLDDGLYTNSVTAKEEVITVADPRSNAYEAFSKGGSSIGQFKTIADAMNAAVAYDSDKNVSEFGSYVTKIGDSRKIFTNKAGFAEGNDDQFYYFDNGNALAGYNCWDAASSILLLHNTKLITHAVTGYGTVSSQHWNSYTLLDSFGELIDSSLTAQSWELSSTMDAGVISFPHRLGGITKLNYTLDLSDVKIAPSYQGTAPTYAFIGFYAWQDYYVIATGIACNTATGNWHHFIGTSRDDSFSDVQYDIGECILTSTFNEEGKYFVPDANSLTMSIETKIEHDDEWDEDYQVDYMKFEFDNGAKFERNITDSLINNYFPGFPLGYENSYAFIAGLDIKNDVVSNVKCENTDYFNGSYFEGLKVTAAKGYVPTTEEMSDVRYGYTIDPDWRGEWHDFLLANNDDTPDVLDYTILNTALCAEYTSVNNADCYNFSYKGNPISTMTLAAEANGYQAKIDQLGSMNIEDLLKDSSLLDEVGAWLLDGQTIVPQRIFLVLDFTGYYAAKELLENNSISEAAKAVAQSINALQPTDYEQFGEIYEGAYSALEDDEKRAVKLSVGSTNFENMEGLYLFTKNMPKEGTNTVYTKLVYVGSNGFDASTSILSVKETLDNLLSLASLISVGTQWRGTYDGWNDDPNNNKVKIMNGDNNFWPSMRIVDDYLYLTKDLGLTLPNLVKTLLEMIGFEDFYTGFYMPIFSTTSIALKIDNQTITSMSDLSDEELEWLNEYWVGSYIISEQLSWNWENGHQFEDYFSTRTRGVTVIAGANGSTLTKTFFLTVSNFLASNGYSPKTSGWGVYEEVISK